MVLFVLREKLVHRGANLTNHNGVTAMCLIRGNSHRLLQNALTKAQLCHIVASCVATDNRLFQRCGYGRPYVHHLRSVTSATTSRSKLICHTAVWVILGVSAASIAVCPP